MNDLPRNTILIGDVCERLRALPPESVDCVITSPPYFQLRDYGVAGQIGLEASVNEWVARLVLVMRELARVLKPSGSIWLNLGDTYSRGLRYGAQAKSLLLAPERLALRLVLDGWILRNKVVWAKANPMPTSVADRLNTSYDVVYLLVRSRRYHFDLDAIRLPHLSHKARPASKPSVPQHARGPLSGSQAGLNRARPDGVPGHPLGKNPGDVWRLSTQGFRGAHFATFPIALVERPLLATCPERLCAACGQPWRRPVDTVIIGQRNSQNVAATRPMRRYPRRWSTARKLGHFEPTCSCSAPSKPGVVLDPFFGSGTVGVVAERHRRDWLGIELKPDYVDLAWQRIVQARPPQEAA